jgi:catechol 2,3-dioxygenase-like lactoylglutathione lyase family enzyme
MKMTRLIPMLPVEDIAASIAFYQKLGFVVEQRRDDWGWAMLRFDECRIMVDRSINRRPETSQSVLYLYPENVVVLHQKARSCGLRVPELDFTMYGLIEFRLADPDGNRLWIGQKTGQLSET